MHTEFMPDFLSRSTSDCILYHSSPCSLGSGYNVHLAWPGLWFVLRPPTVDSSVRRIASSLYTHFLSSLTPDSCQHGLITVSPASLLEGETKKYLHFCVSPTQEVISPSPSPVCPSILHPLSIIHLPNRMAIMYASITLGIFVCSVHCFLIKNGDYDIIGTQKYVICRWCSVLG